jgi:fibro-slime domain-containing protein
MKSNFSAGLIAILASSLVFACSSAEVAAPDPSTNSNGGAGGPSGRGSTGGGISLSTKAGRPVDNSSKPAPPGCGDGVLTKDEACDDGNRVSGDGCSANCLQVEVGFSCVPEGQPCHHVARCGDGVLVKPELCDDGNTVAGDGCSPDCKIEIGYKCANSDPSQPESTSVCTTTTCGDGIVEGAESCDDGNAMPFDGCSSDCQNEPNCTGASCTSRCGDGIVLGEACDDGNNVDGDGCSADCKIEQGYTCSQPSIGDKMMVPVIYRDFRYHNPSDFQPGVTGQTTASKGMVSGDLDKDGKPVFTGLTGGAIHVESTSTFAEWYRDTPNVNHATASKLALYNNGKDAYVNRYGANGEQWYSTEKAYYCGNVGAEQTDASGNPIACTSKYASSTDCQTKLAAGEEMLKCNIENGNYTALFIVAKVDGNPLFFPVDDDNFTPASEREGAQVPPLYDPQGTWPYDTDANGVKRMHNFSFTSEVRYWFKYDASKTYQLDFVGDDDVWVFINKKLALDIGGIHTPVADTITLNTATAASQGGMKDGNVYEVAVFQAERQTTGSSYKLTLSGFNAAPSDCKPICGDGIVEIGEDCDDGKNTGGGYGQCGPGCKLQAGFCGDGIVQQDEDCDDGVNNGNPCPSGCRTLIVL